MKIRIHDLETSEALNLGKDLLKPNPDEQVDIIIDSGWSRPFGMAYTACVLKQFRKRCPEVNFRMSPIMNSGLRYAANMGFFQMVSPKLSIGKAPGEAHGNRHCIPLTILDFEKFHPDGLPYYFDDEVENKIEEESSRLATILTDNDKELNFLFTYLIREILRNIPEHSDCTKSIICGQAWPRTNKAEIAIIDEGKGVFESLSSNPYYHDRIYDNSDALDWATTPGISAAYNPNKKRTRNISDWANSGFGLYMVKEICKEMNGSFLIASGGDYLKEDKNRAKSGKTNITGTAIEIIVDTGKVVDSSELIKTIVQRGQKEARAMNEGFQRASRPSKGKLLPGIFTN